MNSKRIAIGAAALFLLMVNPPASLSQSDIVLENDYVRYVIGLDGTNHHFIDKRDGKDYIDKTQDYVFAQVKIDRHVFESSAIAFDNDRILVSFKNTDFQLTLRPEIKSHSISFRVEKVQGPEIEELAFLNLHVMRGDAFAGCVLALNLQTNVVEMPQANSQLRVLCYPRFGLVGAEAALIGCPQNELRGTLKEVVSQADDLPHSAVGGPWAMDSELSRGSYLFNFDGMTEESVEQWISLAQNMGITQIDFHGGSSFRFGDCHPNPKIFPKGKESFKKIIDRLHAAGISAGLHTYAFFIDKKCPWVTPVPDPRLAKNAVFTLADNLTADANRISVIESTNNMSTTTGFFVRNSVTLQIDDELITYKAIDKESPYAFKDCQRGAYGTKVSVHAKNSKVYHLKECFGLFVPDGDSTLLAEVAAMTAEMYNDCGFDMIYLDALDGEDILGGAENSWHYGSKFVYEIFSRLKKSPLMEMSTFHHHLWVVRSRMGAWDHPTRGHKRFIDIHCEANKELERMFLPAQLGWWAIKTWTGIQGEPTFSDDIEYLCCKSIGYGSGLSMMGINPGNQDKPIYKRLANIIKNYETLRRDNHFNENVKRKLRVLGDEYTLFKDEKDQWNLRPAVYLKHKVEKAGERWNVNNPYEKQPLKLRIEALTSALPYDATNSLVLVDFSNEKVFKIVSSAKGVEFAFQPNREHEKSGQRSGKLSIRNNECADPKAAWVCAAIAFEPPLDLRQNQVLGVWIYGDGKGEVLNFQMQSPEHLVSGLGERYVVVDFKGWKYFELVEMESERYSRYKWPYGNPYSIYRENVNFQQVEKLSIWCNDIALHKSAECWISAIKALPQKAITIENPSISLGDKKLQFHAKLATGQYIEFNSMSDCKQYGAEGEMIADIKTSGDVPSLEKEDNRLTFACGGPLDASPRSRITIVGLGSPLERN
ncbi:MAG: hypothetical protein AB1656_00520 [Candidatus Omnitrophota bacterium]